MSSTTTGDTTIEDVLKVNTITETTPTTSSGSVSKPPQQPSKLRRRGGISSESSSDQSSSLVTAPIERIIIPKNAESVEKIRSTLSVNILFAHLLPEQLQLLVDAMFEVTKNPGEYVIRQGEEGDNFYIVDSGTLDIFVRNGQGQENRVLTVNAGGYFGELALMYNCPRAASVVASTAVVLWALDRVTFRNILLDTTAKKRRFYEGLLANIPILAPLQKYEIFKVADELQQRLYQTGDHIVRQGEPADGFYIVEEGEASVFKNSSENEPVIELKRVRRGDYFGELALLTDKPRAANVVAQGSVTVAYMGCDAFNRLLGPCQELLRNNIHHYKRYYEPFLSEVPILSSLTSGEIKQIADALVPVEFQSGDTVVKQGEPGDTFYIIETGEGIVTKVSGKDEEAVEVKRLSKGDYFGEVALLHTRPRAATVVALTPMKCVKLDVKSFSVLLGSCKDILMRNTELYKLYENYS